MDLYQCKKFFKDTNPGKIINFDFDDKCIKSIDLNFEDSLPNAVNHISFNKVKVTVESNIPVYIPISSHRTNMGWSELKTLLNSRKDVFLADEELENALSIQESQTREMKKINAFPEGEQKEKKHQECLEHYQNYITQLVSLTGLTQAHIEEKIDQYRERKKHG